MARTSGNGRRSGVDGTDTVLLVILLFVGTAIWLTVRATTDSAEGDPFESPLYWWTWVAVPLTALVAGLLRPRSPHPPWWALALVAAAAVDVAVEGTVLHDPDDGASFWVLGEMFVAVQALFAFAAAMGGQLFSTWRQ